MNCLTCRHLRLLDYLCGRLFICGHDSMSDIDSNGQARLIAELPWLSDETIGERPEWCPLRAEKPEAT